MKKTILILIFTITSSFSVEALTKSQLDKLTIDLGAVYCWSKGKRKYIVIDYVGTQYAVNGSAKSFAKKYPKRGWLDARTLLKNSNDYNTMDSIISLGLKSGCTPLF